jgi:hypothetical protein
VPVGSDIPLVIQVGKWRRQITVPVTGCIDNALIDVDQTRLPRNKLEGDIPRIAISTGFFDSMECLPRRLGIDESEITTFGGEGRIHLFAGTDETAAYAATKAFATPGATGADFASAPASLWGSLDQLMSYDIVLLSCEGDVGESGRPEPARQTLYDYTSQGGRVFASHWHDYWFANGPDPVPTVGTWEARTNPMSDPSVATINTSFPKGAAMAEWLLNVGASTTLGQMSIASPRDHLQASNAAVSTEWMTLDNDAYTPASNSVQVLSFSSPLGAPEEAQCGRTVYTGLHVSATGADNPGAPYPSGCEDRELSAQEKAIVFMLFDLSGCLIPDNEIPRPPVVPR